MFAAYFITCTHACQLYPCTLLAPKEHEAGGRRERGRPNEWVKAIMKVLRCQNNGHYGWRLQPKTGGMPARTEKTRRHLLERREEASRKEGAKVCSQHTLSQLSDQGKSATSAHVISRRCQQALRPLHGTHCRPAPPPPHRGLGVAAQMLSQHGLPLAAPPHAAGPPLPGRRPSDKRNLEGPAPTRRAYPRRSCRPPRSAPPP